MWRGTHQIAEQRRNKCRSISFPCSGGRVESTCAPNIVPILPAPAAVPEQRQRSMLEYHRLERRADRQRMSADYRRLTYALLLSLVLHALMLALTFGGEGRWLLNFSFPWKDRRTNEPDLRVVVAPPLVTPAATPTAPIVGPSPQASVEQPGTGAPALAPSASGTPTLAPSSAASRPEPPTPPANAKIDGATGATTAQTPARGDLSGDTAPSPVSAPSVIAVEPTDDPTWVVPPSRAMPSPDIVAAPSVSIPETPMPSLRDAGNAARARTDQVSRERALELAKVDQAKQEAQRQAEQLEAARQETAQQDAARREAMRAENARLEAERLEAARSVAELQETARQVAVRREAALIEAAKAEAAKLETARAEAAKAETARIEAAKVEAARADATKVEAAQIDAAKVEAARVEAVKVEAARDEVAKVEAARVEAARVETARVEAAKVEAARVETAKFETARLEAAKAETARVEAAKVEAARVEATKVEAARIEAAKVEAARVDAAKAETARVETAKIETAKVDVAQDAAATREARLRAIGRQLDAEAALREPATAAARLLPSGSSARRYRLFGRTDPNAEVILYAEAWARKIQLNLTFDMVREAAKQPHTDPLVTVSIRSDGAVESVTIVKSSGVPALDEAIRRVVYSQTPYEAFTPGMAREMDVIEIRRSWYFDMAIRLY